MSYTEYAQDYEEDYLEEMPITIVRNLEQYEFSTTIRVHGLEFMINDGMFLRAL